MIYTICQGRVVKQLEERFEARTRGQAAAFFTAAGPAATLIVACWLVHSRRARL